MLSYSEKDNGNFQIDSFEFSALCLLGKDEDKFGNKGEDNVEPCFPLASVTIDKFTVNNKFKEQFDQLLFALNPSYNISSYFISKDKAEKLVQKVIDDGINQSMEINVKSFQKKITETFK